MQDTWIGAPIRVAEYIHSCLRWRQGLHSHPHTHHTHSRHLAHLIVTSVTHLCPPAAFPSSACSHEAQGNAQKERMVPTHVTGILNMIESNNRVLPSHRTGSAELELSDWAVVWVTVETEAHQWLPHAKKIGTSTSWTDASNLSGSMAEGS